MPDSVEEKILVGAAKAIGKASGKIASLKGAESGTNPEPHSSQRIGANGKYLKSDKTRLPRRLKKARQKSPPAARTSS